ncbi:MAG: sigma-54-dependent Fis family transcriptional regulator [Lentisphaerae bacterium]|nr:sigma-54-dependent Fis family transcriptional regulator [Lentisphaerota bacterium]
MARIILVNEDAKTLTILSTLLKTEGYKVVPVLGLDKSLGFIKGQQFDLIILDVSANPDKGVEILRAVCRERPDTPLIVLKDQQAGELDKSLLQVKTCRVVNKPFKVNEFIVHVQKAVDFKGAEEAVAAAGGMKSVIEMVTGLEGIIANSPAMRAVCETIKRVAPTDIPLLIAGEPGTPKESVAGAIHSFSTRKDRPFHRFKADEKREDNAAELALFGQTGGALPAGNRGAFDMAEGGTLFISNIEALPLSVQEKLARAIQDKKIRKVGAREDVPVNVRLLAGADTSLEKAVEKGTFSDKLRRAVSLMPIELKPLRQCKEDILPWVDRILHALVEEGKPAPVLEPAAVKIFQQYLWPGNIVELEGVLRSALLRMSGNAIAKKDLPSELIVYVAQADLSRATAKSSV